MAIKTEKPNEKEIRGKKTTPTYSNDLRVLLTASAAARAAMPLLPIRCPVTLKLQKLVDFAIIFEVICLCLYLKICLCLCLCYCYSRSWCVWDSTVAPYFNRSRCVFLASAAAISEIPDMSRDSHPFFASLQKYSI